MMAATQQYRNRNREVRCNSCVNMTQWTSTRRKYLVTIYCLLSIVCAFTFLVWSVMLSTVDSNDRWRTRREVINLSNYTTVQPDNDTSNASDIADRPLCTPLTIENFPRGVFTADQRRNGAVIVELLVALYMFGALAVVCDTYFMPSIEIICDALHLSEDVAGATFMAIGGSAPELFVSVIGVFIAKGDIGIGTVVGSAVFNILFVIGLCGIVAGKDINLSCFPFTRDSACYIVCILALVFVVIDEAVDWKDSVILLVLYFAYLFMMYFNREIETFVTSNITTCGLAKRELSEYNAVKSEDQSSERASELDSLMKNEDTNEEINTNGDTTINGNCMSKIDIKDTDEESSSNASDDIKSPLEVPEGILSRCLWFWSLPIAVAFYITIPDCRKDRWHRYYPLTFILSLLWVGFLTYVLVWMVTVIGDTLDIPDAIMGLTLLAFGASIPDTILSIIAAREGYGDMAISHSIGSNLFDILVGLGLPWFLETVIVNNGTKVFIYSGAISYIAVMLLGNMGITIVILRLNRFLLDKKVGSVLIIFYAGFLTLSILFQTNTIIPNLTLPEC